jgi:fatty acid desaturase
MTNDHPMNGPRAEEEPKRSFWNTPAGFVLCVFLVIAGALVWMEHRAHILGAWPLLLPLVICVGMHFFMHRGHGGHHGSGGDRDER